MSKYMDIVRLGHKTTEGVLKPGDRIVIMEKIDGANAAFKSDDGKTVGRFSRNNELFEGGDTLRGFAGWVDTNIDPTSLIPGYKYFGEWLVPHKVKYPENRYKNFYLFDIYDEDNERYLPIDIVAFEAARLGLKMAPIFYEGEYTSFEQLMKYVGQTWLGGDMGEGIVVKNYTYRNAYGKQTFVKLVAEAFREIQPQKAPKDPNAVNEIQAWAESVVTHARVEKLMLKLVDNGIIDENFGIEDMGTILKNIGVYEDVMKEEYINMPDYYEIKDIRKAIGALTPKIAKQIMNERSMKDAKNI